MSTLSLYDNITAITRNHLGLEADRFVTRQIRSHLQKDPETLQRNELRRLIYWIELAMRTIYSDQPAVDAYMQDLETLVHINGRSSGHAEKRA